MTEKLTFQILKRHLDASADILRGDIDASAFRQPIMTLLFLRRLSDQFVENAEKLEKKHPKEIAWNDADYHDFFIPEKAGMSNNLSVLPKIDRCRIKSGMT